jgi:hypothetical protein
MPLALLWWLRHERSETGDDCHVNIKGLTKSQSKAFFESLQKTQKLAIKICDSFDQARDFTAADIERELEAYERSLGL